MVIIFILRRKINYKDRIIEIKEAPIGINNILRDPIKRGILKILKKDKKYLSRIAMELGLNPARARFHLKQLENFRLLSSYKLARESYYSLTKKGKWCLDAVQKYYPETVFNKIKSRRIKLRNRSKEIG
ncbi:MAG TPA: helix-turn-helix domain-containing protein [archaeon]|nr:helix-turn-helix domain-containing protein [archaeon]